MLILGLNGGGNLVDDDAFDFGDLANHDSAAVLVEDGRIVAGIEQERLDRIKHSSKHPADAIRFCLETRGIQFSDLDHVAYYSDEEFLTSQLRRLRRITEFDRVVTPAEAATLASGSEFIRSLVRSEFGYDLPRERLHFVRHHRAHAASAFAQSGFERALVVTIDGQGDGESGSVSSARGREMELLDTLSVSNSLGLFYDFAIRLIGFRPFEEYKVMGLAPYGNPGTFRDYFRNAYSLEADGQFALYPANLAPLRTLFPRRGRKDPIEQVHMDVAASLQEALEAVLVHLLDHYRKKTGHRDLCLAGGVAHNCTANGKVLMSGMFDRVFVQPASHDAGCALGAALAVWNEVGSHAAEPLSHVYWGTDIGTGDPVRARLERWSPLVSVRTMSDPFAETARLLADGNVVGWVQGRSEFGPRALGNRSILADPRPAENKDIINAMVKKREAFRPFAPAVLEERLHDVFEVPAHVTSLPFMTFVVSVKPSMRPRLGAITHVDGSARVQTVSRSTNERFWRLIDAFAKVTDVPVLLNTSFNNDAEPIVDSIDDAVACFLTTGIQFLVVDGFLVSKDPAAGIETLAPVLPRHIRLVKTRAWSGGQRVVRHEIRNTVSPHFVVPISAGAYDVLFEADGRRSTADARRALGEGSPAHDRNVVDELRELWGRRVIAMRPVES